jgi:mono/diheme cytochrome c family protein
LRSAARLTVAVAVLALFGGAAFAQSPAPASSGKPPAPFAPDWAQFAGWEVFAKKDCGKCHTVRGFGGRGGPDLARTVAGTSFFGVAASLWNHVPKMGARMRAAGIARATLTPTEAANLIAFLFTTQYGDESGNAASGEKLFTAKACVTCHMVGRQGGRIGPELDRMKRANSPVMVAAALWNHGASMSLAMTAEAVPRPTLEGQELLDIIAYLQSKSTDLGPTTQVVPGTPERGRTRFADRQCASCHAVGGQGGRVGPDLGTPRHHLSLTEFAARMWNHAPAMATRLKERGADVPQLSGQEVADLLAYLYVSRYFDALGDATRGGAVLRDKGCLGCHAVAGAGGTTGADFTRSRVVRTPQGLVAGMWNHSRYMERAAEKDGVAWPTLTGQDMADLSAYLGGLTKR